MNKKLTDWIRESLRKRGFMSTVNLLVGAGLTEGTALRYVRKAGDRAEAEGESCSNS